MEPGSISMTRALPIDAAYAADVLLRLRRDCVGAAQRWTLGDRGVVEVDVHFVPVLTAIGTDHPTWTTSARLWDSRGLVPAAALVYLTARHADEVELTVRPSERLAIWWEARIETFLDLVHALVDELAEELLFHASRLPPVSELA
jgi:hypothetical protein